MTARAGVYRSADYRAFVATMRLPPDHPDFDPVAPYAAADWLREHGEEDHAEFVALCLRYARVQSDARALYGTDREEWARLQDQRPELITAVHRLWRAHAHRWTGGFFRKPSVLDGFPWDTGFLTRVALRAGLVRPDKPPAAVAALLDRQPVRLVVVRAPVPRHSWLTAAERDAAPEYAAVLAAELGPRFPGVEFRPER